MTDEPAFGQPPQRGQPRNGRRRLSPVLLVALVAVVALLVGGAGGVLARHATGDTGPSAPSGSASDASLPEIQAEFPGQNQQHLPDVALSQVTQMRVEQRAAWRCGPPRDGGTYTDAAQNLFCNGNEIRAFGFELLVEFDDETHVRRVEATCRLVEGPGPGSGDPTCRSIFAETAALAFGGQPDLEQQARDWTVQNIDSDSATTIGGVRIQVSLEPVSILLTPAV